MKLYFKNKVTDCILYSIEGTKFNIHKEILFQSTLISNISSSVQNETIEIFCLCTEEEIDFMLKFLEICTKKSVGNSW